MRRLLIALVTTLGLITVVSLATLIFGHVSGTEFSPESLETRSFSYYEIPMLRWQVTPVRRQVTRGGVEQHLRAKKLVEFQPAARWDLIRAVRLAGLVDPRGAGILQQYLTAQTAENEQYWEKWSRSHATLAEVLWPEVIQLARRRLYVLIPDVMELARKAAPRVDDSVTGSNAAGDSKSQRAVQLRQQIAMQLDRRCSELADWHRQLGQTELADQFREWAAEYAEIGQQPEMARPVTSPKQVQGENR